MYARALNANPHSVLCSVFISLLPGAKSHAASKMVPLLLLLLRLLLLLLPQVDAAEALRLASGLAAAVRELESSTAAPPAVERGQAEAIVRGLVV